MRWLVGLDLMEYSQGALRFARWLHERAPEERFIGVHVLEPQPARMSRGDQSEDEFRLWVHGLARRSVADLGAAAAIPDVAVHEAEAADEGLEAALGRTRASAMILGRKARTDEDPIVRLGRVARRMVRRMPAPVAIVPPDLAEAPPPGPVVVASGLDASSQSALLFARAFARAIGRELVVVTAVVVRTAMQAYISSSSWDRAHVEAVEEGQAALARWLAEHREDARGVVVRGPIGHGILEVCAREQACVLICGSRRLSLLDRLFTSSVGAELAAMATVPVIIVPPEAPEP